MEKVKGARRLTVLGGKLGSMEKQLVQDALGIAEEEFLRRADEYRSRVTNFERVEKVTYYSDGTKTEETLHGVSLESAERLSKQAVATAEECRRLKEMLLQCGDVVLAVEEG